MNKSPVNLHPPILELKDIHKTFSHDLFSPAKKVLDSIHFTVFPQSITAIFGHNGAGKTTCLRLILGLMKPDLGLILFKSHPLRTHDRYTIGYMPESRKMSPELTPYEILRCQTGLFRSPTKYPKERIHAKLADVGLFDHKAARIGQLSKGMGRRLAWALATIHDPELLILDEPFSGLDPLGQERMIEWIKNYVQQGATVIMTSHELSLTKKLEADVLVFKQGKIVLRDNVLRLDEGNFLSLFKEDS